MQLIKAKSLNWPLECVIILSIQQIMCYQDHLINAVVFPHTNLPKRNLSVDSAIQALKNWGQHPGRSTFLRTGEPLKAWFQGLEF